MERCIEDTAQSSILCPTIDIDIVRQTRVQPTQETSTDHNTESRSDSSDRTRKTITFRSPGKQKQGNNESSGTVNLT